MKFPDLTKVLKFGLVGCTGLMIDFALTFLLKEKLHINKYLANAVGFTCAVVSNFILNTYWTFNDYFTSQKFFLFAIISLSGLLLNSSVIMILVKKLHANFYVAKAIAVFVVFLWNFLLNNYITFNNAH
ncbi:MAG: GtrA family protein [Ginsengibacter sp.]